MPNHWHLVVRYRRIAIPRICGQGIFFILWVLLWPKCVSIMQEINEHEQIERPDHRVECPFETQRVVGVVQGIAYLDFGFIEPALLATVTRRRRMAKRPKGLESALATRVAMRVDVLARLHQQTQHVLVSMRDARQSKLKA